MRFTKSDYNPLRSILVLFGTEKPYPITDEHWNSLVELLTLGGIEPESDLEVLECINQLQELGLLEVVKQQVKSGYIIKIKSKYNEQQIRK